jgi:urease accessory protein
VIVIERVVHDVDAAALTGLERDTLRLTWEARRWTRKKLQTSAGREVALALPTGTVLALGAVLCVEPGWYLVVEGEPEPVIAVRPRDRHEALRVAFEVGNRHFSLAEDGDALLVPDDTAMTHLLDRLKLTWERRAAVYSPLGFAHTHEH